MRGRQISLGEKGIVMLHYRDCLQHWKISQGIIGKVDKVAGVCNHKPSWGTKIVIVCGGTSGIHNLLWQKKAKGNVRNMNNMSLNGDRLTIGVMESPIDITCASNNQATGNTHEGPQVSSGICIGLKIIDIICAGDGTPSISNNKKII